LHINSRTHFLNQAVATLLECRRTLSHTYAFAFYLSQESNQTVIFEDNQMDLESATEKLSRSLEIDLKGDGEEEGEADFGALRRKVGE
jgi:ariadne-1